MRTGRPEFHPDVTDELVDRLDLTPERREIVRRLAWKSVMSVPLTKRGRVIGGLQFVLTDAERRYSEDDLTLAEAVAGHVASALENRRLTDQQHLIASTLQASLLPDRLPDIPNLAVAVRYWASGEGTEVGGDFYDLFAIDDGTWAAVIGDICGTGPLAASLTSLARNTIRLCGWRGDDAVTTLNWLNRAMLEARPGWFLTGAYVTLHPRETGVDLEVTVAGHPLPVIVAVDGTARLAGEPGTLLGSVRGHRPPPDGRASRTRGHARPLHRRSRRRRAAPRPRRTRGDSGCSSTRPPAPDRHPRRSPTGSMTGWPPSSRWTIAPTTSPCSSCRFRRSPERRDTLLCGARRPGGGPVLYLAKPPRSHGDAHSCALRTAFPDVRRRNPTHTGNPWLRPTA